MDMKQMALDSTILRATVGSELMGLKLDDKGDTDEMGICLEPLEPFVGFQGFDQLVYRTAEERDGAGAKSQDGDLDLTIYGLKRYLSLALKGNPTILTLLFVPPERLQIRTQIGDELQALAPKIISRRAGGAFLGYLKAQRERLIGERGQKDVNRPELVAAYGFDTKYACHACRLGIQGVELLTDGKLTLPMAEPWRTWLRDLRVGKHTQAEAIEVMEEMEGKLKILLDYSPLPKLPDEAAVQRWMIDTYYQKWTEGRGDRFVGERN